MSVRGYTRRDHRHRKRRSRKSRSDLLLDKLLKIFFYILVVLVAIILIKIVFDKDKAGSNEKESSKTSSTTTLNTNATSDSTDESTNPTSDNTTSDATSEPTTAPTTEPTTEQTTEPTTEPATQETPEPTTPYIPDGDYRIFDEAAFVGDSRIGGLYLSSQLTTSNFYYDIGGNVHNAVSGDGYKLNNGSYGSAIDALRQREFEYVFLQYGVNEFGWSTSAFVDGYEALVNQVKAVQPNAKIYVMAIIPVTAQYAIDRTNGEFNVNARLDDMDAGIKAMAERVGVNYINVVEGITGGVRVLEPYMSNDGYHLNKTENLKMLDFICNAIK